MDIDISKFEPHALQWLQGNILSLSFAYQSLSILCAFLIAAIAFKATQKRISKKIDNAELPIRVKRILHNLRSLTFAVIALCSLEISIIIGSVLATTKPDINIQINLIDGVAKAILAWIFIRIAAQFIENQLLRSFFSFTIFAVAALSIFGVLEETTLAMDAIGMDIGSFRLSVLNVIKGIISLVVLLYVALFASTFAERRVLQTESLTRSSQVLAAKVIRIILVVFALLIGVTAAGIDLSIFTVFSGAVGLGVGFGLQKVVSNLFSGLLLLLDKSITPGDVIELEKSGTFGWVNHMGARYTEIITRNNKSYLIPNEEFITQSVVNWSHGDKLIRIQLDFGVHYKSDPHEVIRIAIKAATRPARVVETPSPVCWINEFGDSSVNFTLNFWIKDAEAGVSNVRGDVFLALWDAFQEHNIEIPYPQRVVHMVPET